MARFLLKAVIPLTLIALGILLIARADLIAHDPHVEVIGEAMGWPGSWKLMKPECVYVPHHDVWGRYFAAAGGCSLGVGISILVAVHRIPKRPKPLAHEA